MFIGQHDMSFEDVGTECFHALCYKANIQGVCLVYNAAKKHCRDSVPNLKDEWTNRRATYSDRVPYKRRIATASTTPKTDHRSPGCVKPETSHVIKVSGRQGIQW